jgi:hypothetical protein
MSLKYLENKILHLDVLDAILGLHQHSCEVCITKKCVHL